MSITHQFLVSNFFGGGVPFLSTHNTSRDVITDPRGRRRHKQGQPVEDKGARRRLLSLCWGEKLNLGGGSQSTEKGELSEKA